LGTGSGSAVHFIDNDNDYTGTDISPGLLRKASKRFLKEGFHNLGFFVISADDLPFEDDSYEVCLCILSLNFIGNIETVFREVHRVLCPGGAFYCCVPVPERNRRQSKIRGILYSETELAEICKKRGFEYVPFPFENGVLLYFKAISQKCDETHQM
jgi:ubiquinone/menaquinone biosynthesis C-methylase UbiE